MASTAGGQKTKRPFWNRFKLRDSRSTSTRQTDENENVGSTSVSPSQSNIIEARVPASTSAIHGHVQEHSRVSPSAMPLDTRAESFRVASPLVIQSNTNANLETVSTSTTQSTAGEGLGIVTSSSIQPNVKEGLEIAGRFVKTLLKKLPECADGNPVKVALSIVKTIINIKDEIGDNKDALTEGLKSTKLLLSDAVGKVELYDSESIKKEIENYKRKIEEQNTQLLQITKELKSILRHMDYENYKKKINNICKVINETTNMFMLSMQIEIRKTTALMHDQMKEEQKARLTKSLKYLKPSAKANHKTIIEGQSLKRETCAEGTRVKILGDITNWANDRTTNSPQVFWLTGQAGSGKTTIAYTVAKRFEKGQPTILGASFLCSRQFEETRSLNRILPTIAYQLAYKCGHYETALHAHVPDKSAVVNREISEQMEELLVGPWSNVELPNDIPVYLIVIDALDEISEEGGSQLLDVLLTTINQQDFSSLKFLVTSRTDPRIVELCDTFESKAVCRLQDVAIEDAEADVEKYLDAKLPNIVGCPELAELRRRASGLFIYAATAVRLLTLSRSITYKEQIRRLNNILSKTSGLSSVGKDKSPIDGLYEQILYEAFSCFKDEEDLTPRLQILFIFVCAAERISPSVAGTLMDEEDDELARAVLNDLHAVLYIQDGRVFWYHASFPDFLFAQNRSNFRVGNEELNFWCNQNVHNNLLAASCLRVMSSEVFGLRFNFGDITSSYLLDSEHADELSKNVDKNITPVLRYSSFHWARHLSSTPLVQTVDNICSFISTFLQIRFLFWIEAMNLLGSSHQCAHMLHLARQWVLNSKCATGIQLGLSRDLIESANFATYFTGSPAAESTPHLYISSLATWKQESSLSQIWKTQFACIPVFTHGNAGNDLPLLTIRVPGTLINTVALSHDGTQIASGALDYVRIWDASTCKELNVLKGHTDLVRSVAFASDDKCIASGSDDSTIRVWDTATGECLKLLKGHAGNINSVAFSKTGLRVVSGSNDESIRLWDVSTGEVLKVMLGHTDSVSSVAFSGDGAWIASGSDDRTVRVWDASTGEELRTMNGHTEEVNSVAFSGRDAWIASGSDGCSIRVWDALTGEELRVIHGHSSYIQSVAFSGNGAWIASGSDDHSVRVWDASTGEALKVLKGHANYVFSVRFSTDATRIVSGSWDGSVRVWNVSAGTELDELENVSQPVNSVALSSDGTRILFGSNDGSVHLWDVSTWEEFEVLKEGMQAVNSVVFSADGKYIAWGSGDKVWVWDMSRDVEVRILEGHADVVESLAFSSDGTLIVSVSRDHTLRLWDVSTGVALKSINGHPLGWVMSVAFSLDGKRIVSGSDDSSVRVWDVSLGEALMVMKHSNKVLSVAFSSDAARIVSGSYDMTVRVWDTLTGTELKILHGHTNWVLSVAFSSDDTHIVSGSDDNSLRVWNVSTGEEINTLRGRHTNCVKSVAFSRDDRPILSGSTDGSVIIWDMENPIWYLAHTNWILSSSTSDRLMWVPPDVHILQRPNCRVIAGGIRYSSFNFEKFLPMMGPAWHKCYTPT